MKKVSYYCRADIPGMLKMLDKVEAKLIEEWKTWKTWKTPYLCDAIYRVRVEKAAECKYLDKLRRIVQHSLPKQQYIGRTLEAWWAKNKHYVPSSPYVRYMARRAWINKLRADLRRYYDENH